MKRIKTHAYTILFSSILLTANAYSLLKTFVLPTAVASVTETGQVQATPISSTAGTPASMNCGVGEDS